MSLLQQIQTAAVDGTSDLGTILRQCKLLAARLGSEPLEHWLVWESNGYPVEAQVPNYRVWPLEVKGHFGGSFGSGLRNAPIPHILLPEDIRESYERYECRQSVAALETILRQSDGGRVSLSTGDLAIALGMKVYQGQNCLQAWAEFGTSCIVELLNSVRNRILDFSLALWKEAPEAGELGEEPKIEAAAVTQIFNTVVYGGSANVMGSVADSQITAVSSGNLDSLLEALAQHGIPSQALGELQQAIEQDDPPREANSFGPNVSSWIARMVERAASGSWNVGLGAAGNLLAQCIGKYYGL